MAIVISGTGIDMGNNPVSNASQIDSTVINESGSNVRTENDSYSKTEVDSKVVGFKNYIINGGFDIWQRGTSFSGNEYTADRYLGFNAPTVSRVTAEEGYGAYGLRLETSASNSGIMYRMESKDSAYLVGKDITISVSGKKISGDSLKIAIYYATAVDTFSGYIYIALADITFDTNTSTQTVTFSNLPAGVANGLQLYIFNGNSLASINELYTIQLEEGSVATPFEQRPYGLELSLCQRYYEKCINNICIAGGGLGGLTDVKIPTEFKVTKRVPPSMTIIGGTTGTVTLINPFIDLFVVFYSAGLNNNFGATLSASAEL